MDVLWYNAHSDSVEPYDKNLHALEAHKFLFWGTHSDGILLVGPDNPWVSFHKSLHENAYASSSNIPSTQKKPRAAGDCNNGIITGWVSTGYQVLTPEHFRGDIADALGMTISHSPKMDFTD